MAGTDEDKRQLRRRIRAAWRDVSVESRARQSRALCAHLVGVLGSGPTLLYMALSDEASLRGLIEARFAHRATVVLPRVVERGLDLHQVGAWEHLAPGRFGILEPRLDTPRVMPEMLDAVVLPGRAFDASGARLGRGGGYYDRLMATLAPDVLTVGVALEHQLVDAVPVAAHDRPVHVVMTNEGWRGGVGVPTPCRVRRALLDA